MGARCDYRKLAREVADSPRQRDVVEELLSGASVGSYSSPATGLLVIGTAGLRYTYWMELCDRLARKGIEVYVCTEYPAVRYRIKFPGQ
jgi:hypothetical protein